MKKQIAVCAGLLLGIGSVQAQAIYAGPGPFEPSAVLPPYEIMSIVRSTGLAPLTRPMRRGSYYVLVAVDRVGRQMRVVVDAQLGDIVNMRPATAAGPFGAEPGRLSPVPGAPPPDAAAATGAYGAHPGADNGTGNSSPGTAPPRSAANPHAAGPAAPVSASSPVAQPQTRMAVGEPALPPPPPLPRPRPKLALNEAPPVAAVPPPAPAAAKAPAAVTSEPSQVPPSPDAAQIE
ncbi:MAG TPA: hypothetical protein VKW08_10430 [Xanthobacteraceae bacterium]|nr:hypothetical protein [Xanthobacteraceae bacterium]